MGCHRDGHSEPIPIFSDWTLASSVGHGRVEIFAMWPSHRWTICSIQMWRECCQLIHLALAANLAFGASNYLSGKWLENQKLNFEFKWLIFSLAISSGSIEHLIIALRHLVFIYQTGSNLCYDMMAQSKIDESHKTSHTVHSCDKFGIHEKYATSLLSQRAPEKRSIKKKSISLQIGNQTNLVSDAVVDFFTSLACKRRTQKQSLSGKWEPEDLQRHWINKLIK